jgi:poly-gamma-glutamate capsule biosynthesis protein CapA/YwtB (metallophosphatase superfamily)
MTLKINIFGDLCLYGIDPLNFRFGDDIKGLMNGALNIGNLECPITEASTKKKLQTVNFKVSPDYLNIIEDFQVVSLCNNHIADYLDQGIQDTIRNVEKKGIRWFGVGKNYDEALNPCVLECQGHKIAIFGSSRFANFGKGHVWGTAVEKIGKLKKLIKDLKQQGYFVIPYFHWGYEYVRIPSPRERKIAKACIDAGADIVIGAHPHVFQAYEVYKGKHIFYSLGNAIFLAENFNNGMAMIMNDPRLFNSFAVSITLNDEKYTVETKGYQLSDTGLRLLNREEEQAQKKELEEVSNILRLPYEKYWKLYYRQAVTSCNHHIRLRHQFQKIDEKSFKDKFKIMFNFNSQDLRNRLAHLFHWFFE